MRIAGTGRPRRHHHAGTLHAAPEPAVSPVPSAPAAGVRVAVGHQPEGLAVDAAGVIAVAVRQPDGIDRRTHRVRFVPLEGAARHLELAGRRGPLLVPDETSDRIDELALPSGRVVLSVPVGHQPHDAAATGSGPTATLFAGDELASTVHVIRRGRVVRIVPAPLQPGGLAFTAGSVLVVGVRARLIAAYRPDGTRTSSAAAGVGPTHVVAGPTGVVFVADTLGGAVLAYRVHGGTVTQTGRFAVGPRPYGLAYDQRTAWLYVTLTRSDRLLALRTAGGAPSATRSWATGRQPNSVAVDPSTGTVVVADTRDDRIQLITP